MDYVNYRWTKLFIHCFKLWKSCGVNSRDESLNSDDYDSTSSESYASVTGNMNYNSRQLAQAESTTMDCNEASSTELSRAQQASGNAGFVYQTTRY